MSMSYAQALEKAWLDLSGLTKDDRLPVNMLSGTYTIEPGNKKVTAPQGMPPAKDYIVILLLHYLIKKLQLKTLPKAGAEWIDFRSIDGGEAYYPTFKKRTIDHILKKYGSRPEALLNITGKMPARKATIGDTGIIVDVFEEVPILITMSKSDEEFGPDANILFDKNISKVFCTEDIVVLTEIVTHKL